MTVRTPTNRSTLPVGTVLLWDGVPAVVREESGWRYVDGRYLGDNEVDALDWRPYTVRVPDRFRKVGDSTRGIK